MADTPIPPSHAPYDLDHITPEQHLKAARSLHDWLHKMAQDKIPDLNIDSLVTNMRNELAASGQQPSALDIHGKQSTQQVEAGIWHDTSEVHVSNARLLYKALEAHDPAQVAKLGYDDVKSLDTAMRNELKAVGKDLTALDETGNRTAREMEAIVGVQESITANNYPMEKGAPGDAIPPSRVQKRGGYREA